MKPGPFSFGSVHLQLTEWMSRKTTRIGIFHVDSAAARRCKDWTVYWSGGRHLDILRGKRRHSWPHFGLQHVSLSIALLSLPVNYGGLQTDVKSLQILKVLSGSWIVHTGFLKIIARAQLVVVMSVLMSMEMGTGVDKPADALSWTEIRHLYSALLKQKAPSSYQNRKS